MSYDIPAFFTLERKKTTGSAGGNKDLLDTRKPPFAKIKCRFANRTKEKGGFVA